MCRLAAWVGAPRALEDVVVAPPHSLLTQSQDATEAKLSVNGDGFGIAWYQREELRPGLYRDVMPAWSDGNLPSLCRMIRAPIFLAHVRASTGTETSRPNCHPFTSDNWSFMHNGQIGGFRRIRRVLEASLPDELYEMRRGSTDSELLFLLLIAEGVKTDVIGAMSRVMHRVASLRQAGDPPDRITCVLSDGAKIYALRHASDARAPTLYMREEEAGVVLASEPLDADARTWSALGRGEITTLDMAGVIDRVALVNPAKAVA